jgi:hypothetical protein
MNALFLMRMKNLELGGKGVGQRVGFVHGGVAFL